MTVHCTICTSYRTAFKMQKHDSCAVNEITQSFELSELFMRFKLPTTHLCKRSVASVCRTGTVAPLSEERLSRTISDNNKW